MIRVSELHGLAELSAQYATHSDSLHTARVRFVCKHHCSRMLLYDGVGRGSFRFLFPIALLRYPALLTPHVAALHPLLARTRARVPLPRIPDTPSLSDALPPCCTPFLSHQSCAQTPRRRTPSRLELCDAIAPVLTLPRR